jgi:hypothetical protein
MSEKNSEIGRPVRVALNIYALPEETDAEALANAAEKLALILEDEGVFDQRGPAPAQVFTLE